ncbi:MAG: SpoIIE family protein phosphatase [Planctomycetes bacterium]|nr:SpoIIE family protein phosphatase [Planctomycetota bacterium]
MRRRSPALPGQAGPGAEGAADEAGAVGTPPPADDARSSRILQAVQGVSPEGAASRRAISATASTQGMNLAVKFALVISGVSAFLMVTTGITNYFQAKNALDDEVDTRGKDLVLSVGELAELFRKNQAQIEAENKDQPKLQEADRRILSELYSERLKTLVFIEAEGKPHQSATVMNAFVTQRKGSSHGILFSAKKTEDLRASEQQIYPKDDQGTTFALPEGRRIFKQDGTLDGIPVRGFKREVSAGEDAVTAWVILSAKQIEQTKTRLLVVTLILALVAILVGILISFILASRVTKPVRKLVEDIAVVAAGDLAHRTIAQSKDEIGLLAASFDAMTQNLAMAHDQELEHKAQEHELSIATEIQSNLLPKKIPRYDGWDIDAFYQPSKQVGGDYYDFIQIDEQHVGIVVADVSGKGVPGSLVMAMARVLIRMEAQRNLSAADTFIKTNRVLSKDIKRGMFVTAMYCILDTKSGVIRVASAGHNPMVIFRAQMGKVSLVNPHGIALGFDKGPIFERTIKEEKIQLNPGDRVVMYTDGVPEAMSPDHKEFGDEQFHRLAHSHGAKTSNQFINLLVQELEQWRGGSPQSDDITITTVKRQ